MPVGTIEREIHDACVRLARSAATARRCHEHYLDDLGGPPGPACRDLAGTVAALTAAHPWALGGFDDRRGTLTSRIRTRRRPTACASACCGLRAALRG